MKNMGFRYTFVHCICAVVIFIFAGCTNEHNQQLNVSAPAKNTVVAATTLLATIADNELPDLPTTDSKHAAMPDAQTQSGNFNIVMNPFGRGVVYIAAVGNKVHVRLNGVPGKSYDEIAAYTLRISPDGKRVAYGARSGDEWVPVVDTREMGHFVDRGRLAFSHDSKSVAYDAKLGNLWYFYVDGHPNTGAFGYFDQAYFSADSSKVLLREVTEGDGVFKLVVSDRSFKKQTVTTIQNPDIVVSPDSTLVAAVRNKDGKQQIIEFSFDKQDVLNAGALYDSIRNPVFSSDSKLLAYLAKNGADNYLVLNGKAERIPDGEYPWLPVIRPDNKGVGLAVSGKAGSYIHQAFFSDGVKGGLYKECSDLTYSRDGKHHAYVAIKNDKFTVVVDGKEGQFFDRTISPQFSPDSKFLVYRARQDGKRFVVVADLNGTILRRHTGYERVFETTFTEDGTSVAYGAKVGKQLWWKVEKLP